MKSRQILKLMGWSMLIVAVIGSVILYRPTNAYFNIMTAHAAKVVCSERFVAGRDTADILQNDIYPRQILSLRPFRLMDVTVDESLRRVNSSLLGTSLYKDEAVYRDGLGCVLVRDSSADELQATNRPASASILEANAEWPVGNVVNIRENLDLQQAIASGFTNQQTREHSGARAIVVVHKGKIVGEQYAEGFDASTRLIGWSMSKTITAALAGFVIDQTDLELESDQLFAKWDDERASIQLKDLLSMSDGLDFQNGTDNPLSDELQQLYLVGDTVDYALEKPAEFSPNANFNYNNGAPALVTKLMREQFPNDADWLNFPYETLFTPLGMDSALFETDNYNNFMGSSLVYATARDWARMGQLLLQNGEWLNKQLLPEGWAEYMVSPNSTTSTGWYSNGFVWLGEQGWNMGVDIPADDYWLSGFDGQYVVVIPSKELVIVRMGLTQKENFETRPDFVGPILEAIE